MSQGELFDERPVLKFLFVGGDRNGQWLDGRGDFRVGGYRLEWWRWPLNGPPAARIYRDTALTDREVTDELYRLTEGHAERMRSPR